MGRYSNSDLECGIKKAPVKTFIYGPEGIGKSTLAAEFPGAVFIDVEGGTNQLAVARMPKPTSWAMLVGEVQSVRDGDVTCGTLVIDTADAAERLCVQAVCAENSKAGIEDFGYGRGYTFVREAFGKLMDALSEVADHGMNVVVIGHSRLDKFERPDESGAYDRFSPKLIDTKKASDAAMVKEWADMVLFLDYDITVVTNKAGKAKATGGKRVIRTNHTPQWDAKNRFGLSDELPLSWDSISGVVPDMHQESHEQPRTAARTPAQHEAAPSAHEADETPSDGPVASTDYAAPDYPARLKPLADLMAADEVTDAELRHVVGERGDFTEDCPVTKYPDDYVGFLTSKWAGVAKKVKADRFKAEAAKVEVPFSETEPTAK
jgi:hypothetical protein